jgi:hypothetical protein
MDEWTGVADEEHLAELRSALRATHAPVLARLSELARR